MDSSGNYYLEDPVVKVTAPTNNGVVMGIEFTLSGDVKDCTEVG